MTWRITLTARRGTAGNTAANPWAAVSALPKGYCCAAVQALKFRRFLAREAPRFPLTDCNIPGQCACGYRKYDDRRAGPRRSEELTGMVRRKVGGEERRNRRGRRQTD